MNAFSIFSLQPSLDLDLEELKALYQNLAAEKHPDNGGDKEAFEQLNTAYQTLQRSSQRLIAYMDAKGIQYDPRGSVSNNLMDLFMQVGSLVQTTDAFLKKKESATSVLAKALLENETLQIQEQITSLIEKIEAAQTNITDTFGDTLEDTTITQHARDLAFLEKWQAQLKQRYAALF